MNEPSAIRFLSVRIITRYISATPHMKELMHMASKTVISIMVSSRFDGKMVKSGLGRFFVQQIAQTWRNRTEGVFPP